MKEKERWGISGGTLKIIALVTMIIDHATAMFVSLADNRSLYILGRGIGRLAFPIYCFLLVEGFFHTHNRGKYCFRLFLFALISEVPFDLAFNGVFVYDGHQNVFFTLLLGLLLLWFVEWKVVHLTGTKGYVLSILGYLAFYVGAEFLRVDYGAYGVLLILCFYLFRGNRIRVTVADIAVNGFIALSSGIQLFGGLSVIPIAFYNGKKGISLKYFFYAIYPLHLLLFCWIKYCLL